jgi:hypothetical protein
MAEEHNTNRYFGVYNNPLKPKQLLIEIFQENVDTNDKTNDNKHAKCTHARRGQTNPNKTSHHKSWKREQNHATSTGHFKEMLLQGSWGPGSVMQFHALNLVHRSLRGTFF